MVKTGFQWSLPESAHTLPIDVSNLANGTYIYKIQTNEKGVMKTMSKKMVKM
jgi:hypothetical protein